MTTVALPRTLAPAFIALSLLRRNRDGDDPAAFGCRFLLLREIRRTAQSKSNSISSPRLRVPDCSGPVSGVPGAVRYRGCIVRLRVLFLEMGACRRSLWETAMADHILASLLPEHGSDGNPRERRTGSSLKIPKGKKIHTHELRRRATDFLQAADLLFCREAYTP
jgi:hypothetical protein